MKTLKKANQQNVELNTNHYTEHELRMMFINDEIWYLKERDERRYDTDWFGSHYDEWLKVENRTIRINCEDAELKVVCHEGYYTNVLVKNGKEYFVALTL